MRNLFFALVAFVFVLSSCNKDNTSSASDAAINLADLSPAITNYVDNYYPDAAIASAVLVDNSKANTIVVLNTKEELAFDQMDTFLGDGMHMHSNTDMSGEFKGKRGPKGRPGMHGKPGMGGPHPGDSLGRHCEGRDMKRHTDFSVDSLPTVIKSYLTTNYASADARHAEIDTTCQFGAVYAVFVKAAGLEPIKLVFSKLGVYLLKGERFRTNDMPQVVKDAIAKFDTNARIRGEKFTLENGTIQYAAFVNNNGVKKRIVISVEGAVLCQ